MTTTESTPTDRPRCPGWCVSHNEVDQGTPDATVLHYGEAQESAGLVARLIRSDLLRTGITGEPRVMLNDEEVSVAAAVELAAVLTKVAASALAPDERDVVVRVMDLPEGKDVVIYRDLNVVAVSRNLRGAARTRALVEAGAW